MKERLKAIFKGPVVFHPLLLAAFPVLFLYTANINETSASQIWLPLTISVAAALVLWALLSLILGSLSKAGLATAIFLAFFFSYGRFYDGLNYLGLPVPGHTYFLPAVLVIWGCCVYFIRRTKRDFRITTRWLNIVAVALIAINLFNIISYQIGLAGTSADTPEESPTQAPAASNLTELGTLPDIYFIILDEYARTDTMMEWYDYDNNWFIEDLEDKGFFIAHGSKTRTRNTSIAVAQVLNMKYQDAELRSDTAYRLLAYSKVAEFLKAHGYRYIVFGHALSIARWDSYMKDNADLFSNYYKETATSWASEFQEILWNTTMLRPFYLYLAGGQLADAWRCQTLYTLEHLKALPEEEGPKFVYAHFMCPHAHYVFDAEGGHVDPVNWQNYADKQFYLGQYIFISAQIEELVGVLLEKSEIPPIIILQSDHGQRPSHPGIVIGPNEWRKILNAMYLPGMEYSEISDSISPVNTFRLIFNHYFDTDYPLLDDDYGQ